MADIETIDKLSNNSLKVEKPSRNEKGQLLPGVVLNPLGKPKGSKHFATLFMEILKEEIDLKGAGKMSMSRAMSLAMARKAIRGDVSAFNAVADRVDGKPAQDMTLEVSTPPSPIYNGKSRKKV